MRSISVTIFSAEDTIRKSRATGCCCNKIFRHIPSISRSLAEISPESSVTCPARAQSPVSRAWAERAIAVSQRAPMEIISFFSRCSC